MNINKRYEAKKDWNGNVNIFHGVDNDTIDLASKILLKKYEIRNRWDEKYITECTTTWF